MADVNHLLESIMDGQLVILHNKLLYPLMRQASADGDWVLGHPKLEQAWQ